MEVQTTGSSRAGSSTTGPSAVRTGSDLKDLAVGQRIDLTLACTEKVMRETRSKPRSRYLKLTLRGKGGDEITAFLFTDDQRPGALAERDAKFNRGDGVRVQGVVEERDHERLLKIHEIEKAVIDDPETFLVTSYSDPEELFGFVDYFISEVQDPSVEQLLAAVFHDPVVREALRINPCTLDGHHSYAGGLLHHTWVVASLAELHAQLHPQQDFSLLVPAALLHDIGKTREIVLTSGGQFAFSEEAEDLTHEEMGAAIVYEHARSIPDLPPATLRKLVHCILTHHDREGRRCKRKVAKVLARLNAADAVAGHSQS